jgi:hypothetical protein
MTQTTTDADKPKCFKPLSHRGEEKDADLFLRNKRGTLVPLCEPCYDQFMETCKATIEKGEIWKNHQEWLDKPEPERKISIGDGMVEFQEQEKARIDGSREGPSMTGAEIPAPALVEEEQSPTNT